MGAEDKRVAVVTGANRGIGLEICRQLARKSIDVVLTSRDEVKGRAAVGLLGQEGLTARYYPCDVADDASVERLKGFCEDEVGRCDILVNNAGIFPDADDASRPTFPSVFTTDIALMREAMETNAYGTMRMCQALVPLMKRRNYGRIVNLSSGMGQLADMNGCYPAYRVSKTAINALTRIMADELKGNNILVNTMCPGWVKTDMGGRGATRELPEGADTAVWLATLPDGGPAGKFFRDRKEFAW